jgi:uncharacterized protein (DUF1810 family)
MVNVDPYDLNRFVRAQEPIYQDVIRELGRGRKQSHWMWFIFPQIDGLGFSVTSKYYALKSVEEARQYLDHTVLGSRLRQCTELVLQTNGKNVSDIFEYPDDMKLHSSMTLFDFAEPDSIFARVLEKYFDGKRDKKTIEIVGLVKDK